MLLPDVPPLLAADPGTIIGLIVGALTLLGWIMNYANQKQAQQPVQRPQRPRPQRPADDRLQSEIDIFLEEVRGGRRKLGEEPARSAPAGPRPAQRTERAAARPVEQRHLEPKLAPRVEPRVAKRKRPGTPEDRSRVRPRVTEHISTDRIEAHAGQLGRGIEAAVQSHLGLLAAAQPAPAAPEAAAATPAGQSAAQRIRTMLREPEGVRQAVLISEILSRPRRGRS
jgi:hypothetical protein